jgi:hypothetical protein
MPSGLVSRAAFRSRQELRRRFACPHD